MFITLNLLLSSPSSTSYSYRLSRCFEGLDTIFVQVCCDIRLLPVLPVLFYPVFVFLLFLSLFICPICPRIYRTYTTPVPGPDKFKPAYQLEKHSDNDRDRVARCGTKEKLRKTLWKLERILYEQSRHADRLFPSGAYRGGAYFERYVFLLVPSHLRLI